MSGDERIRAVERADLVSIHRIERAVFDTPWSYHAFESVLSAPAFLVAVTPDGGTVDPASPGPIDGSGIVGYVVADRGGSWTAGHVKNLAVRPDRQGEGLGRQLLRTGLSTLGEGGVETVRLEVRVSNEPARSLYRSEGFTPARRLPNYYADGETAVVMTLELGGWIRRR